MTIEITVDATSVDEANEMMSDMYWDMPHEWHPNLVERIEVSDGSR